MTNDQAYYNEIDPYAAQWLRNLIGNGYIAPGEVDERDIRDVKPKELLGYTQCHFFAGIGIWSYALRQSGWPDDKPVWTGSCPCQPFSAAGKSGGFDDERHLWPAWHWLIQQCRPAEIFGEQVASKAGLGWFDLVSADLESTNYAVAAADLCAAGVGTPGSESRFIMEARHGILGCVGICPDPVLAGHIRDFADDISNTLDGGHHLRQRLYWYAKSLDNPTSTRCFGPVKNTEENSRDQTRLRLSGAGRDGGDMAGKFADRNMADSIDAGSQGLAGDGNGRHEPGRNQAQPDRPVATSRAIGIVADNPDGGCESRAGLCDSGQEGIGRNEPANGGSAGQLANTHGRERDRRTEAAGRHDSNRENTGRQKSDGGTASNIATQQLANAEGERSPHGGGRPIFPQPSKTVGNRDVEYPDTDADNTGGRLADWLYGRDGVWRPVEPGTFPLAHGSAARVGRLRAYGNGLDFETAISFIQAVMETK